MSEELDAFTEGAKAVQEASKTGKALVDATSDLGKWAAKVLGTVPEDLVGLAFGDYLRELRIRVMDRISRRTEEILEARGVEEPKPIGPKLAIPAFEAASEETDETLQELWARLLANALDPNSDVTLQRDLVTALKGFEPIDAVIFREHAVMTDQNRQNILGVAARLPYRQSQTQLSAERIERLGCFVKPTRTPPVYPLSALGKELWLAIKDGGDD